MTHGNTDLNSTDNLAKSISQLDSLHAQGVLTSEEVTAKKLTLLNKLAGTTQQVERHDDSSVVQNTEEPSTEETPSEIEVLEFPPTSLVANVLSGGIFLQGARKLVRAEIGSDRVDLFFGDESIESLRIGQFTATYFNDGSKGKFITVTAGERKFKVWGHIAGDDEKFDQLIGLMGARESTGSHLNFIAIVVLAVFCVVLILISANSK